MKTLLALIVCSSFLGCTAAQRAQWNRLGIGLAKDAADGKLKLLRPGAPKLREDGFKK